MSDVLFGDEHVRKYEETDGEVGHVWQDGVPTLVLTTTGRKTGQPRKFALIYQTHGDSYVVVASKGGAPDHPGWYKNLVADPHVTVQVGAKRLDALARTARAGTATSTPPRTPRCRGAPRGSPPPPPPRAPRRRPSCGPRWPPCGPRSTPTGPRPTATSPSSCWTRPDLLIRSAGRPGGPAER